MLSCDKSLREFSSSSNEWRTLPTHRPSQPTRAVSPPVGCYCLHPPLSFIITQPENWLYFTISHFNQSTTLLFMFFYHLTLQPINNSLAHVLLPSHTSTNQQLSCSCSFTISHFNQSTTHLFMFFYHLTLQPINNSLAHVLTSTLRCRFEQNWKWSASFLCHQLFDLLSVLSAALLKYLHMAVSRCTPSTIKTCHFVFDYNSSISCSIFIIFVPVKTWRNILQFTYLMDWWRITAS